MEGRVFFLHVGHITKISLLIATFSNTPINAIPSKKNNL